MPAFPFNRYILLVQLSFFASFPHAAGQAKASQPEIQKHSLEAAQALREGRPSDAELAYQAILQVDPSNLEARTNLGIVAMAQRKWEKASSEFRKALQRQPSLAKAEALMGLCELHMGRTSEGLRSLVHALPHLKETKLRLEAGLPAVDLLHQSGELEGAAKLVQELLRLDPANLDVLYAAYRVHSELSMRAISSMALAGPNSVQLHRALAEHSVNEGRIEEALNEYRKALAATPNAPGVHYEYGQALLEQSHLEANLALAQTEFETALKQNPAEARPECELGRIALWRSDSQAASAHYERAAERNPDLACAQVGLAGTLMEAGKKDEALVHLESAVRSAPSDTEAHHRLANLYLALGRKEDANRELAAFKDLQKLQDQVQKAFVGTRSSE